MAIHQAQCAGRYRGLGEEKDGEPGFKLQFRIKIQKHTHNCELRQNDMCPGEVQVLKGNVREVL